MLNRDMQEELGERIANVIRKYDNHIIDLPYEQALSFVARLAVVEFAMYVDPRIEEFESMIETLSILSDDDAMAAIAEGESDLLTMEDLEALPQLPQKDIDPSEYDDDGTVVWHDTAEEAFQANENE